MILNTGHLTIRDKPEIVLELFRQTFLAKSKVPENKANMVVV
jgi:hypothetical protein